MNECQNASYTLYTLQFKREYRFFQMVRHAVFEAQKSRSQQPNPTLCKRTIFHFLSLPSELFQVGNFPSNAPILVCESSIIRVSRLSGMVVCAGVIVLVECCPAVFFREQFLDFPVVLLGADGEF